MAKQKLKWAPRRGEVYFVNFDPSIGSEIKNTRPALILQNDIANRHSAVTIVAAITSQFEESLYPTEVLIEASEGGLEKDSVVLANQIRTVGTRRLIKKVGMLSKEKMERVDRALQISLGLVDF